jgi:THAP domain
MSFCAVGGCSNSKRKAQYLSKGEIQAEDELLQLSDCDGRILLDDQGTCFEGTNIRFHCMPKLPKLRDNASQKEKAEFKRVHEVRKDWIHAIGRADKLPKDVRVCSLHFAPKAYDMFSPMKAGVKSLLEVPTRNLLLPQAIPTEYLVCTKKSVITQTDRSVRMKKKESSEIIKNVLKER